jgi:gentisate 1,2-dioxygenase
LPQNFKGETYRSSGGTMLVCVEGEGATTIDGTAFEWRQNNVFVVPQWKLTPIRPRSVYLLLTEGGRC